MAYVPTDWVDGTTPVNAANMDKIEAELVRLGTTPSGADLVYNGAFPANTPYTDGDIVVYNGIAYLCVRPTSAAPTPWPTAMGGYGTTLPASPVDGQEFTLVDSVANPTYQWRFRYNASSTSTYKWEFIGGFPAIAESMGDEAIAGDGTWKLPSGRATLTLPRAGDYRITVSARFWQNAVALQAVNIGHTLWQPATNVHCPQNGGIIPTKEKVASGVSAGTVVDFYYQAANASGTFLSDRVLTVLPKRVS